MHPGGMPEARPGAQALVKRLPLTPYPAGSDSRRYANGMPFVNAGSQDIPRWFRLASVRQRNAFLRQLPLNA